jgi:hypothetical protein
MKGHVLSAFACLGVSLVSIPAAIQAQTLVIDGETLIDGNVGRNDIAGPDFANLDMTALKSTTINDRLKIDFRAEFFSLLNHASFALPSSVIFDRTGQYSGSAGHISLTVTTSRQIQFGLKFVFWALAEAF